MSKHPILPILPSRPRTAIVAYGEGYCVMEFHRLKEPCMASGAIQWPSCDAHIHSQPPPPGWVSHVPPHDGLSGTFLLSQGDSRLMHADSLYYMLSSDAYLRLETSNLTNPATLNNLKYQPFRNKPE